jgi:hypothetical protein
MSPSNPERIGAAPWPLPGWQARVQIGQFGVSVVLRQMFRLWCC